MATATYKVEAKRPNSQDYRRKIDLPNLNTHLPIEEFLDWLLRGKYYFEIAEAKQVRFVTYKFRGSASASGCNNCKII